MSQNTGQIISLRINLDKLEKERIYKGAQGSYLDCILFVNEQADKFGNCGMITQQITKEERQAGVKGPILGNGKILSGAGAVRKPQSNEPKTFKAAAASEKMPWE